MRQGYIRSDEDIKTLILYSLSLLPFTVNEEDLLEIVMIDDGFGYFEFAKCFYDLIESRHISVMEAGGEKQYLLTLKGKEVAELMESHLRPSVKEKVREGVTRVIRRIRRKSDITATHLNNGDGTYSVRLSIRDRGTDIASIALLVYSEEMCAKLEENFRARGETIFQGLIALLMNGGENENSK